MRLAGCVLLGLSLACGPGLDELGEGVIAQVGDEELTNADLAAAQSQFSSYGQARFRGLHGKMALIQALVEESLLVQEGRDAGLENHPIVQWAIIEELATLHRDAELERRLPTSTLEQDQATIAAWYAEHSDSLSAPERRTLQAVRFRKWEQAEEGLARLMAGQANLEDLGEVVETPLTERDDARNPGVHRFLFALELGPGELIPQPILAGDEILVGRVGQVIAAGVPSIDDPEVRAKAVAALRAERTPAVEREMEREIAEGWPFEACDLEIDC